MIEHLSRHCEFDKLQLPPQEAASILLDMVSPLVVMASVRPDFQHTLSAEREAARIVDIVLHGLLAINPDCPPSLYNPVRIMRDPETGSPARRFTLQSIAGLPSSQTGTLIERTGLPFSDYILFSLFNISI